MVGLALAPIEQSMNKLCPMPGCRVEQITQASPDLLHVAARGTRPGGRCPDCGHASRSAHSAYRAMARIRIMGSHIGPGRELGGAFTPTSLGAAIAGHTVLELGA